MVPVVARVADPFCPIDTNSCKSPPPSSSFASPPSPPSSFPPSAASCNVSIVPSVSPDKDVDLIDMRRDASVADNEEDEEEEEEEEEEDEAGVEAGVEAEAEEGGKIPVDLPPRVCSPSFERLRVLRPPPTPTPPRCVLGAGTTGTTATGAAARDTLAPPALFLTRRVLRANSRDDVLSLTLVPSGATWQNMSVLASPPRQSLSMNVSFESRYLVGGGEVGGGDGEGEETK